MFDSPAFSTFLAHLSDARLIAVAIVGLVAGAVRGFSGFGAALIYAPLVGAIYTPSLAAATLWLITIVFAAPLTAPAFFRCDWRSVLPLVLIASATVPLGAALLLLVPPPTMRWILAAMVFAALLLLIAGQRFHPRPGLPYTLAIGVASGVMGGAGQMSGPPVVVYWLGSAASAAIMRANLMVFFTLTALASGVTYYLKGLFTLPVLAAAVVAGPAYALGMAAGTRLFGLASDQTFRRIAIAIVALAALVSLPIFDRLYR